MRRTFEFEDGVRLTSDFESGNLWQCFEFAPESANQIPAGYFEEGDPDSQNSGEGANRGANNTAAIGGMFDLQTIAAGASMMSPDD